MLPRPVLFPLVCAWAAGLALVIAPAGARADSLPPDGSAKLESQEKDAHARLNNLINGTAEATKDDQDAIDTLAKWYAYRLTWTDYETKPGLINSVMQQLESDLLRSTRARPATDKFLEMFTHQLIVRAKDALGNKRVDAIAKVNEARVLARVAKVDKDDPATARPQVANEEVVDALVDVIKDPAQNDGARYWAFRGLQEAFTPDHHMPPNMLKDQERQKRCIEVLNQYVLKKMPVTAETPLEQGEGLRTLRREAIRALAVTSYPAVADPKTKKFQSETALTLERVVVGDGLVPPPRWDEQIEAAIGLGWLQVKLYPEYQPDYAAWFVGRGVSVLAQMDTDAGNAPNTNRGWRYYAERMSEALENMQKDTAKNVKDKEVVGYVKDAYKQSTDQLKLITTGGQVNVADLNDWLQNHPPKNDTAYKGAPDAKVKFGGEASGKAADKEK